MADDDWESKTFDEEEAPKVTPVPLRPGRSDKWEGEDEEEGIKDNWDDEEEQESKSTEGPPKPPTEKQKRNLKKIAREKEEKEREKARAQMSPEELAAEKLRQQKLQEEAELQMVKSTFGSNDVDLADPLTKDDFDALRKKIVTDLRKFEKRAPFEDFMEDFIQDLCLSLSAKRLKTVKTKVEALYFEKSKAEKATTTGKGKGKPVKGIKITVESDITNVEPGAYDLDDYDDFM